MAQTYRAILRGDRVEWLEGRPQHSDAVEVRITVVEGEESSASHGQGLVMAEILAELDRRGTFSAIPDPAAWQREQRQDRALAHRGP